jgi:hypothetical protein
MADEFERKKDRLILVRSQKWTLPEHQGTYALISISEICLPPW